MANRQLKQTGLWYENAHPVAAPVVHTDVDKRTDATLEERSNVVLRREEHVVRLHEVQANLLAARREAACDGWVDADG